MIGWVLLIAVVVVIFILIGMYNSLVRLKVQVDNAWADIDVQLKRRYDLIPNLVEVAKGYMKHESTTLEAVIKARNIALAASQSAAANPADGGERFAFFAAFRAAAEQAREEAGIDDRRGH